MTCRKENGQFSRGQSGNPNGRPAAETAAVRTELALNLKEILQVIQQKALGGDMQACKMVLDRICPPLKPQAVPIAINLPPEADITQIAETFIRATADGCLSPDIAAQMVSAVGQLARIVEVTELKNRLEALEHSFQKRKK